jgi:DNA relaxase NicK
MLLEPAGEFFWAGHQSEMGSLLELSGLELAKLRSMLKISDDELLSLAYRNAVRVSRVDFAANINAGDPAECRSSFDAGECITKVKGGLQRDGFGMRDDNSVDIGSRGSKKYIRVYDKAAELGLLHDVLTRIELQCTGRPADRLASAMLENGVKEAGKKAIKQHADFPKLKWYQDAISGAMDRNLQLTPREKGNILTWLNDHVGPAMEKNHRRGQYTKEMTLWLLQMYEKLQEADIHQRGDDCRSE